MRLPLRDLVGTAFFCDPAGGRKEIVKRVAARSAIVGVGIDALTRVFVLDAWAERCTTGRLIETILAMQARWRPPVFGIEANALQTLFADAVGREAAHQGASLPLVPVYQPTKIDKDWRIKTTLQPVLGAGRLFIPPMAYELRAELGDFPMGRKDLVDALASAVNLLPIPASRRDEDQALADLAAYLRDSGAPPHYIETRIHEARQEARAHADRLGFADT